MYRADPAPSLRSIIVSAPTLPCNCSELHGIARAHVPCAELSAAATLRVRLLSIIGGSEALRVRINATHRPLHPRCYNVYVH